jgi:proteasome lid subunit RPN8/RPN11
MFKYSPNVYIGDISQECIDDAIKHAKIEFPNESCGIVVDNTYIPLINEHLNPDKAFEIKSNEFFSYYVSGSIQCLIHSHNDFNMMSVRDQILQQELDIPFCIINLKNRSLMDCIVYDPKKPVELIGRPFFFGVFDCLTVVSTYIKQTLDIDLPNPPKEWNFWLKGMPLFEDNLKDVSYEYIQAKDRTINDLILYTIGGTKYVNHVGVLIGKDEVLHHLCNHISGVYPMSFSQRYISKFMRLKK